MRYNISDFEFARDLPPGRHPKGKEPRPLDSVGAKATAVLAGPPGGGGNGHSGNGHGNGHGHTDSAAWIPLLAQACRQFYSTGQRHHFALALAGMLRNSVIEEFEALAVLHTIATITGDDEPEDRLTAVRSTYTMPVGRASGTKAMQQLLGPVKSKELFRLYNDALDRIPPKPVACPGFPVFEPYDCYPMGSFFDEFICYAREISDAPVQFLAAGIMTMVAGALGNRSYIYPYYGGRRLYPNLYTMLIAPPERYRKSESIRMARQVALVANVEEFPNDATMEAWHARMATEPIAGSEDKDGNPTAWKGEPQGFLAYSEFSRFLSSTTKGHMLDIKPFLTDLYDGGVVNRATKKNGNYWISNASVSVLAGVTPTAMRNHVTAGDMGDGFLSRWQLIVKPNDWMPEYEIAPAPPSDAIDKLAELGKRLETIKGLGGAVGYSSAANSQRKDYEDEVDKLCVGYDNLGMDKLAAILCRLKVMCSKIGLVYASGTNPGAREIDGHSMRCAIGWCRYVGATAEHLYEMIKPDEGNKEIRYRDEILRIMRRCAATTPISRSALLRMCRLDTQQLDRVLDTLREEDRIVVVESFTGRRGRPGKQYRLNEVVQAPQAPGGGGAAGAQTTPITKPETGG